MRNVFPVVLADIAMCVITDVSMVLAPLQYAGIIYAVTEKPVHLVLQIVEPVLLEAAEVGAVEATNLSSGKPYLTINITMDHSAFSIMATPNHRKNPKAVP